MSETAISELPTLGLKDLEVLRLQDTDSLKMFPSIYNFEVNRMQRYVAYFHETPDVSDYYCAIQPTEIDIFIFFWRDNVY